MSKSFRFWVRCATVATLSVLVTFNPAWAGRGLRKWLQRHQSECCPVEVCCTPVVTTCAPLSHSAPAICCDGAPIVEHCGIPHQESMVAPSIEHSHVPSPMSTMDESSSIGQFVEPAPMPSQPVTPKAELSPSDNSPPKSSTKEAEAAPKKPELKEPAPAPDQPAPEPAPMPETVDRDSPFPPADTTPNLPAEDLFGDPAPAAPGDDLFNNAPAIDPPADNAAPGNDLFNNAPAIDPPADNAAPGNDLFNNAPAIDPPADNAAPGNDLFNAADSAPPADNAPAGNDLFNDPAPPVDNAQPENAPLGEDLFNPAPAEPAPALPGNDLFDAPAQPVADMPAGGDLFANPPAEPALPAGDLFDPPAGDAVPAGETPVADESLFGKPTSSNNDPAPEILDLFGSPENSVDPAPSVEQKDPFVDAFKSTRIWRDNTGNFEVHATLAEIHPDKIRLLKTNGKFSTVPMNRLSSEDRDLVTQIAKQLPAGQVKFVSTK